MINAIITAGGLSEPIDNVRSITNKSTGMLSSIIAEEMLELGFNVYYIHSKTAIKPKDISDQIKYFEVNTVFELDTLLKTSFYGEQAKFDVFVHAMAVSDYYVKQTIPEITNGKIDSNLDEITLRLSKTPKIISSIRLHLPKIKLFGFKLMSNVNEDELYNTALSLGIMNHCDFVVANLLERISDFEHNAKIIDIKSNQIIATPNTKNEIANIICQLCL